MSDDLLMKPATTLDDVLKEVRELREEVRRYQEAIEPDYWGGRSVGRLNE